MRNTTNVIDNLMIGSAGSRGGRFSGVAPTGRIAQPGRDRSAAWRKLGRLLAGLLGVMMAAVVPLAADVLYLNAGEEMTGRLLAVGPTTVTFQELGHDPQELPIASVAHVLLSTIRDGDDIDRVENLRDLELKRLLQKAPGLDRFPDSDLITLRRVREYQVAADGSAVYRRRMLVKVLKEPGISAANQRIFYYRDREKATIIHAHTYAADGHVYHLTDDALSDSALFRSTPEYDKLRRIQFAMKKVEVGSVIDVLYEVRTSRFGPLQPYLIDFKFREREPVLEDVLRVELPKNRIHHVAEARMHLPWAPRKERREQGDRLVLTWTARDLPETIPEQNMPIHARIFPRVTLSLQQDWPTLAAAWQKAKSEAQAGAAEAVAAFHAQALAEAAAQPGHPARRSQKQIARDLYDAVLKNIRDIGADIEDATLEPVPVKVTLGKRYGNALARLVLLEALLAKSGIGCRIGFVTGSSDPRLASDVPEFGQFSEPFARIQVDDTEVDVTCNDDYLPFGVISGAYQGCDAVLIDAGGRPEFVTLPDSSEDANLFDRQVLVDLDSEGNMAVREVHHFAGPRESGLRQVRAAKEKQLRIWAERQAKSVHPNARLEGFAIVDPHDMASPLILTLDYRISDVVLRASDQLMAFRNLWIGYNAAGVSLATRTWPLEAGSTARTTNTIIFRLPAGYRWVPWGRAFNYDSGDVRYSSTMKEQNGRLVFADRTFNRRKYYPDQASYDRFRDCITMTAELGKQWIVLERADGKAVGGATPVTSPAAPVAAPSAPPAATPPAASASGPLPENPPGDPQG